MDQLLSHVDESTSDTKAAAAFSSFYNMVASEVSKIEQEADKLIFDTIQTFLAKLGA